MDVRLRGDASGPCAGLCVVDFSTVVAGPFCTMILGDLGADVIKVEPPGGDSTRLMGPPFSGGLSAMFTQFNRNKRSVVLDLKQPGGRDVATRLARTADVVVQNFRPGVAERLGIDYATLATASPGLVYLAISGFGSEGPYAAQPAYDTIIQGLTGLMPSQGDPHGPALIRSLVADKTTALTGVYGILAALLARQRGDGRGQLVDVAMLDAYAAFILPEALLRETFPPSERWQGTPDLASIPRTWATADGHVVMLPIEDAQFHAVCRVLDCEDLVRDSRFASLPLRILNRDELDPLLEHASRKLPTADLVARARELGAPIAPANGVGDFLADPQVATNETVFEVDDAVAGRVRYLANPVRLRRTPPSFRRHPPRLGEHTNEVLRAAGYDDTEIAALAAQGATQTGTA